MTKPPTPPNPARGVHRYFQNDGAASEPPSVGTMSSRLAFQTQLASIMEVLANAAVAEICKLMDDDYAVVSLQMSQCQRENKSLKRKLHLLELKTARGNAERRLRESAMNGSRARVQIHCGDRLRESSPTPGKMTNRTGAHFKLKCTFIKINRCFQTHNNRLFSRLYFQQNKPLRARGRAGPCSR